MKSPLRRLPLTALLLVGLSAGAAASTSGPLRGEATVGAIAFVSDRDGVDSIYLVNADGTGLRRLVTSRAKLGDAGQPSWSPDGSRLAFTDDSVLDDGGLYVATLHGRGARRLNTE